jgi:FkbH-like protein
MYSFLELSRNSKLNAAELPLYKLAIIGDSSTQYLSAAIKGYAFAEGWRFEIFEAEYNQLDMQILNLASNLYSFSPQGILIFMCTEKLYEVFCGTPLIERKCFADTVVARIKAYWETLNTYTKINVLQLTFAYYDDKVFGNFSQKVSDSFAFQLQKLNYLLAEASQSNGNVYLIDINTIISRVGIRVFFDSKLYYMTKAVISLNALPNVAKEVIDIVNSINGRIKKCIILDLDNTLWGGVIGDDGLEGIQIGELGLGHAFTDFQMWLKELKNRGIILAVCSKNNERTAKEPFEKHPDMVLSIDDISIFVANWDDKAKNIHIIKETLNIGMNSIVFIDDNKFEREAVKALIPELYVPDLPEDPVLYLDYLKSLNLFEIVSFSDEDIDRTAQYKAESVRMETAKKYATYEDYLQSLEMTAYSAPFDKFHYPRIAQLTQRSNQFNLRTGRYTEAQIEQIVNEGKYITLYFNLCDKFGNHGLISIVIMEKHIESLFIKEWLMSCRVLKRGMEEFVINKIVETARLNGYTEIMAEYIPTIKNSMVEELYDKLGFDTLPSVNDIKKYRLLVNEYEPRVTAVREVYK